MITTECETFDYLVTVMALISVLVVYWLPVKLLNRPCTYMVMIIFLVLAISHFYATIGSGWIPQAARTYISKSMLPIAVFVSLMIFWERPRPLLEFCLIGFGLYSLLQGVIGVEWSIGVASFFALTLTLFIECKGLREQAEFIIITAMLSISVANLGIALILSYMTQYDMMLLCRDPPDTLVVSTDGNNGIWILVTSLPLFLIRYTLVTITHNKLCCLKKRKGCCCYTRPCVGRAIGRCGRVPTEDFERLVLDSNWGEFVGEV